MLNKNGVPAGVMVAPVIPGLNSHEIPSIIEAAANAGACSVGMTMVRLNDAVAKIFEDWIYKACCRVHRRFSMCFWKGCIVGRCAG